MLTTDSEPCRMIEPVPVHDIFVSGLGEVEDIGGGCFRFTLFIASHNGEDFVVAAKLIMPREAVIPALTLAAKGIGLPGGAICKCKAERGLN